MPTARGERSGHTGTWYEMQDMFDAEVQEAETAKKEKEEKAKADVKVNEQ